MLAQAMSVQGLITRTAKDLHLAMPTMIEPDPRDPYHVPLPWRGEKIEGPVRVAFTKDSLGFEMHPEVSAALDTARDALHDAGYMVEEVDPPLVREAGIDGYRALMGEMSAMMGDAIRAAGSETINAIFDEYFRQFPPFEGAELLAAMARRTHYARAWSEFLETYPLVLTPFLLRPFFSPGRDAEGADGVHEALGMSHYSFAMNFTGLPAGNLPTRLAEQSEGPKPIGVQIVSRRWREDLIVDAMEAIEARVGQMAPKLWQRMETSG
jgi:amidase